MSERIRSLERQRLELVARSDKQRQQLVTQISGAHDTLQRLRAFLRVAATVARIRRFWSLLSG